MKRLILVMTALLATVLVSPVAAADYALVVNRENPVSTISSNDVKQIFLGKKTVWDGGAPIMLYIQQDEQVTALFVEDALKKTPQQFQIYWKKALFTGTGKLPIELHGDSDMKKFIAADVKGIGYISRSALDESVKEVKLK